MKTCLRLLLANVCAWCLSAAVHAQALSPSDISAEPASAQPGDPITFKIGVKNSVTTDFSGQASFTVTLRHKVTGETFQVTSGSIPPVGGLVSKATVDPGSGQTTPGVGSFEFVSNVPLSSTQAGEYTAKAEITAITGGTGVGSSYGVNTVVLTVTGKPDLQITALNYPAGTNYTGGMIIPFSLKYRNNIGTNGTPNVPYVPTLNGHPAYIRIQVVLSANPAYGDADDFRLTFHDVSQVIDADGAEHTITWNQLLPGNFAGSYYVLAKIDALDTLDENDAPELTMNGNNVWGSDYLNPSATLINLLPSNFPAVSVVSHATGAANTASGYSDNPALTADGRYVAFASDATNLVEGDTNGVRDIFILDSQTNLVRRLSLSQQGVQANGASNNPAISSANGRYVAFESTANNLVIGDTNGFSDIFVVDTVTGLISRVSGVNASGGQANNPSFKPAISQTGRYIVYQSTATNLASAPTVFGVSHVYLHDRDVMNTGVFDTPGNTSTRIIDVDAVNPTAVFGNGSAIQPTISADGTWVAFASKATNLVPSSTTPGRQHVYLRRVSNIGTGASGIKLASCVIGSGAEGDGDSQTPSLSADGSYLVFATLAANLAPADTNGVSDIYLYDNTAPANAPVLKRMSISAAGNEGHDPSDAGFKLGSINPTISENGRYVAFASLDNDLTAGDFVGQAQTTDANRALDVFVHDRQVSGAGAFDQPGNITTVMVSVNSYGYQTTGLLGIPSTAASNIYPVISANGRFVAFPSDAENVGGFAFTTTNQLSSDSNNQRDVFLHDRRTDALPNPTQLPQVTITNPGNGSSILVNTPIQISANATAPAGTVQQVEFYASGTRLGADDSFPYSQDWTPTAVGTYVVSAVVTDSFGNQNVSANITVNVPANQSPSVALSAPANGATVRLGGPLTIAATASDVDGTIAKVDFFANGTAIGSSTVAPYKVQWVPMAEGFYRIVATATDNAGTVGTSSTILISASPGAGESIITGTYQGMGEIGKFALVSASERGATFVAYSTTPGANKIYYYSDVSVDASGGFYLADDKGVRLSGSIASTGGTGSFDDGRLSFIGVDTSFFPAASSLASGYYASSLNGRAGSKVAAIAGADGSLMLYAEDGAFKDSGSGTVDSSGRFNIASIRGNRFTGRIDPLTMLLEGSLSGDHGGDFAGAPAALDSTSMAKVNGTAEEVGHDIYLASVGNTYDQVLLQGPTASITADPDQITRLSYVDLSNDIVQIEFSGAGRLSVTLDNPSGLENPVNYNQPGVQYVRGHAGIVITGADETTNVSVFSVGRVTALNQSLFKTNVAYDGVADLAYIVILSRNGKFGGVRTANASYSASAGITGICAPGVEFLGPVYVGDINAFGSATPLLQLGSAQDVRVTGGDFWQSNNKPVQVNGLAQLKFVDGTTSHGVTLPAQHNSSPLEENGVDVTARVVVNPK